MSETANTSQNPEPVTLDNPSVRLDGIFNYLTGMGDRRRDASVSNTFAPDIPLTQYELENIYRFAGMGRRIVDLLPAEALRQWVKFPADTDGKMLNEFKRLDFKSVFQEFLEKDRLNGGAVIVIGAKDGGELQNPLNEKNISEIEFLRVYDRWQVTYTQADYYEDPMDPNYGRPKQYLITPYNGTGSFYCHHTRMIIKKGIPLPDRLAWTQQGWGDSVLQPIKHDLFGYESVGNTVLNLLKNYRQSVMSIKGLHSLLAGNADNEAKLLRRLNILDLTGGVMNTLLFDADTEGLTQLQAELGGIVPIMQELSQRLSASTGFPESVLMGRAASGLNANGQTDLDILYDKVKAYQTDKLEPIVNRMATLVMRQKKGPWRGRVDDSIKAEWNPLRQRSDVQEADYKNKVAQTDVLYINAGVLDPSEVATSRFGGDTYSADTVIDDDARKADPERFTAALDDNIKPPTRNASGGPGGGTQ